MFRMKECMYTQVCSSLHGYSYLVDLDHPTGGHWWERREVCKCTHIGKYMCS